MNDPLDSKIRAAMVELAEAAPAPLSADELGIGDTLPMYSRPAVAKPSLRTRLFRGLAGIGILAGGAGLAVVAANSGDEKGTPEEAFAAFTEALSNEDTIGLLEAIDPNEREALRPAIDDVLAELNRLGILENVELSSDPLEGFDFDVTGLDTVNIRLADGLAAVKIVGGEISSQTQPGTLPVGDQADLFSSVGLDADMAKFANDFDEFVDGAETEIDEYDIDFLVVERDGEWYLSLGYTLLDGIAKNNGWESPDFGNGITPNGQATPEALVDAWMVTAPFGFEEKIALLDPQQVPALYDYGAGIPDPFFRYDGGDWDVNVNSATTTLGGDRVTVATYDITYTFTGDGETETTTVAFDGRCVSMVHTGEAVDEGPICVDDPDLAPSELAALENLQSGYTVVERDGLWYLNPVGSFADDLVASMAGFDEVTEANSDTFMTVLFSNSLIGDVFGLRNLGISGVLRSTSSSFASESESEPIEVPEAFRCTDAVYDAIYNTEDAPNLDLDPQVRVDFETCLADAPPLDNSVFGGPNFELPSYDRILAAAVCGSIYDDVYNSEDEPPQDEIEAADAAYEQCLADQGVDPTS